MTTLNEILSARTVAKYATESGTKMHTLLQHIVIDDKVERGDAELVSKIKRIPELVPFFSASSRTEVPVAGTINGRFVSRRIDRLCINHKQKHIDIIDYKTDIDHDKFYSQYSTQLREYCELLRAIYPDYSISAYILWTHDFSLEKIAYKQV